MSDYRTRIRMRQRELELTNDQVARKIGVSVSAYAHYKNGTRRPDMEKMNRIAKALNTNVQDIFYNEEEIT